MTKIISTSDLSLVITRLKKEQKRIVLTGGCFDILHIGHVKFLKEAKKNHEILMVLLESDDRMKLIKGEKRPHFGQMERAEVLSALTDVDYVYLLPFITSDQEYARVVSEIHPDVIAVTQNDPLIEKKKRHTESVGATLRVIAYFKTFSSSRLAQMLGVE